MATFRTILNNVLIGLGEDEIPTSHGLLDDKYHKLLGLFVNHIKEIVEDEHQWRVLRTTENITIDAGSSSAVVPSANERSRVYRVQDPEYGELRALVFDVTESNNPYRLREMDLSELLRRRAMDTATNSQPSFFAMDNTDANEISVQVWPTPNTERTVQVTMITPQPPMANDKLDTIVLVPSRPIEVGTLWYALEERGEELGVNGLFNKEIFDQVLGAAVARDAAEQGDYNLVPQ